jgi:hypothetical protein
MYAVAYFVDALAESLWVRVPMEFVCFCCSSADEVNVFFFKICLFLALALWPCGSLSL